MAELIEMILGCGLGSKKVQIRWGALCILALPGEYN